MNYFCEYLPSPHVSKKVSEAEAAVSATRDVKTEGPVTNRLNPSQQTQALNG